MLYRSKLDEKFAVYPDTVEPIASEPDGPVIEICYVRISDCSVLVTWTLRHGTSPNRFTIKQGYADIDDFCGPNAIDDSVTEDRVLLKNTSVAGGGRGNLRHNLCRGPNDNLYLAVWCAEPSSLTGTLSGAGVGIGMNWFVSTDEGDTWTISGMSSPQDYNSNELRVEYSDARQKFACPGQEFGTVTCPTDPPEKRYRFCPRNSPWGVNVAEPDGTYPYTLDGSPPQVQEGATGTHQDSRIGRMEAFWDDLESGKTSLRTWQAIRRNSTGNANTAGGVGGTVAEIPVGSNGASINYVGVNSTGGDIQAFANNNFPRRASNCPSFAGTDEVNLLVSSGFATSPVVQWYYTQRLQYERWLCHTSQPGSGLDKYARSWEFNSGKSNVLLDPATGEPEIDPVTGLYKMWTVQGGLTTYSNFLKTAGNVVGAQVGFEANFNNYANHHRIFWHTNEVIWIRSLVRLPEWTSDAGSDPWWPTDQWEEVYRWSWPAHTGAAGVEQQTYGYEVGDYLVINSGAHIAFVGNLEQCVDRPHLHIPYKRWFDEPDKTRRQNQRDRNMEVVRQWVESIQRRITGEPTYACDDPIEELHTPRIGDVDAAQEQRIYEEWQMSVERWSKGACWGTLHVPRKGVIEADEMNLLAIERWGNRPKQEWTGVTVVA